MSATSGFLAAGVGAVSFMPTGTLAILKQAETRRVSLLLIGDSEARQGGHGIADAIAQMTFENGIEPFRTPIYLASAQGGNNMDGWLSGSSTAGTMGPDAGAASEFNPYRSSPMDLDTEYAYYTGVNVTSANNGVQLDAGNPLDLTAALRAHFKYGTFLSGGGSFRPSWRRDNSPFTGLAQSDPISAQTGEYGTARSTFDLIADAERTYPVRAQWSRPAGGNDSMEEDFLCQWVCVERPDRTAGLSVDVLYGRGGMSLYDMAAAAIAKDDVNLGNFLADVRGFHEAVGQTPEIVIAIKSDLNDTSETLFPSLGPNPSDSPTSAAAWTDNLTALIDRLEEIYDIMEWDKARLHFLIIGSHDFATPNPLIDAYHAAGAAFAASRDRCEFLNIGAAWPSAAITTAGFFADGTHLTSPAGYNAVYGETIAQAIIDA